MKVYGYVRVSGDEQKKKDGPIRQQTAIAGFCEQFKLEFGRFFSDLGVSGTIEGINRPGLMDLITEAELNGAEAIVVESMDRLARDLIVSEMIFRELKKRNIKLFAVNLGFVEQVSADVDPSRKLIRQIFAAMAEFEKSSLVLKLRAARERIRREKGRCEGGPGYSATREGTILLNLIMKSRGSGCSWGSIAALLNRGGLKKKNGTPWTGSDARKIFNTVLRNQKAHEHHTNKRLHEGSQPDLSGGGKSQGSSPAGM